MRTIRGDKTMLPGKVVVVFSQGVKDYFTEYPHSRGIFRTQAQEAGGHLWPDGGITFRSEAEWEAFAADLSPFGITVEE
jgi:hypothetical protein